jgi:hypothetical protein
VLPYDLQNIKHYNKNVPKLEKKNKTKEEVGDEQQIIVERTQSIIIMPFIATLFC